MLNHSILTINTQLKMYRIYLIIMEICHKLSHYFQDNNLNNVQNNHHIQMENNVLNVNYQNILIINQIYVKYANKDTVSTQMLDNVLKIQQ